MRRSVGRLLPRLLAGASEASLAARQSEASLLPRLAAAASGGQHVVAATRSFKSSAAACSSSLVEALKTELEYERENYTKPEELAAGRPPGGFDLSDAEGDNLMTLSKQLPSGEQVTIDVLVDEQPEEELVEDESGALDADVGALFTATITKGDSSLVFECKSDGQYFVVNHASLEPAGGEEASDSAYTGPVYEELDEELQKQFEEYLAERGVTAEIGAFLLPLIHDKEQREYMRWLQSVHAFVAQK